MKPLELKMKNFLGFKEETSVNFKTLYEDKIFLITGPTGAGKTSIFDAICYALYGEGSGEVRSKAKCFRSQLAEEKEEMEVSLLFEVHGHQYFVKRIENAKGLNKAYFSRLSHEQDALVKIKEVNQEIETIIGLNLDQFKKIVMIPQGEFREFLTAGTKDKSDILKKLFATEQYERIQLLIKERYDQKKSVEKDLILRFAEILKEAQVEHRDIEIGADALQETLNTVKQAFNLKKQEKEQKDQELKLIEQELMLSQKENEELETFRLAKETYENIRDRKKTYENMDHELKLLRKISGITHTEKQLEDLGKDIKDEERQLMLLRLERQKIGDHLLRLEKTLTEAKKQAAEVDVLKEKKTRLQDLLEKSKKLKALTQRIAGLDDERRRLQEKISYFSKKEQHLQNTTEEEEKLLKSLSEYQLELEKLKSRQKEHQNYLKELGVLYKKMEKYEMLGMNLEKNQRDRTHIKAELLLAVGRYEEESQKKNGHYAMILRQSLRPDKACPVCGSLHHPLGVRDMQGFDEERFLKAEEDKVRLERKLSEEASAASHLKEMMAEVLEECQDLKHELQVDVPNSALVMKIGQEEKSKFAAGERKVSEYQNLIDTTNSRAADLTKLIGTLRDELSEKNRAEELYEVNKIALLDLSGEQRGLIESGVPKESLGLINQLEETEKRMKSLLDAEEAAKLAFDKAKQMEENLKGKESSLIDTISINRQKCEDLKAAFKNLLLKEGLTLDVYSAYRHRISQVQQMEEDIQNFYIEYNKSRGVYEALKDHGETLIMKDLHPLKQKLKDLLQEQKNLQESLESTAILLHNLTRAHERLGTLHEKYMENKKALVHYQDLYDTAYLGMNFETFVQSYYFEGILLRANERLRKMSEGRYQLKRRNETESRREKIGLGLNVFDEYTGRERDVQSLSGGESFKASLSLALGLSDFIESHKGSVNLETIFIDEGFGSLDQDSLENALGCLMELNVSGRIVGIISHVTELKDRIPGKIEVKTTPGNGSTIKITGGNRWN